MRRFVLSTVFFVAVTGALFPPSLSQADSEPLAVEVVYNVEYGRVGDFALLLDLFLPKNDAPQRPAILMFHGGGWVNGTRKWTNGLANHFARLGYVCGSVEYRLSDQAIYPAAVEDSKCAVRWLRANAEKYRVDTERIAALGGSAGGHLAAILGTTDASLGLEGTGGNPDQDSRVTLVIAIVGVFDMRVMPPETDGGVIPKFLGGSLEDLPEVYKQASPVVHVDERTPPVLMLHAVDDQVVPFSQAELFSKVLDAHGIPNETYRATGGHNFLDHDEAGIRAMEDFLSRYFGEGKPSSND